MTMATSWAAESEAQREEEAQELRLQEGLVSADINLALVTGDEALSTRETTGTVEVEEDRDKVVEEALASVTLEVRTYFMIAYKFSHTFCCRRGKMSWWKTSWSSRRNLWKQGARSWHQGEPQDQWCLPQEAGLQRCSPRIWAVLTRGVLWGSRNGKPGCLKSLMSSARYRSPSSSLRTRWRSAQTA